MASFSKMWQKYEEANCRIVFHASLGNIKPGSKLEFRIPFVSIAGNNQSNTSAVTSAVTPRHERPSGSPATPLFDHGEHVNSLNAAKLTYPVHINLGSPARDLTGNWRLPDGFVDSHTSLEKEVVITISPRELDKEFPVIIEGVQGTADVFTLIEVPRSAPPLLAAQEYLFLVDRSTSMYGLRIAQARDALKILIKSLPDSVTTTFVSHCFILLTEAHQGLTKKFLRISSHSGLAAILSGRLRKHTVKRLVMRPEYTLNPWRLTTPALNSVLPLNTHSRIRSNCNLMESRFQSLCLSSPTARRGTSVTSSLRCLKLFQRPKGRMVFSVCLSWASRTTYPPTCVTRSHVQAKVLLFMPV